MTTSDIAARILCGLTSAALVVGVGYLIIRDRLRERGVAQSLLVADMRASDVAADTLARQEAERRLLDWQAHVNGVFLGAMSGQPEPTLDPLDGLTVDWLTVVLDDDGAVAEWLEAGS